MEHCWKIERPMDMMLILGLNETRDNLATTNSVHWHGHVLREDGHVLREDGHVLRA